MTKNINRIILDKIADSSYSDNIKKLLKNLLILELDNKESGKSSYTKEYDSLIEIYIGE